MEIVAVEETVILSLLRLAVESIPALPWFLLAFAVTREVMVQVFFTIILHVFSLC